MRSEFLIHWEKFKTERFFQRRQEARKKILKLLACHRGRMVPQSLEKILWVSTRGNDKNPGTIEKPLRTLNKAMEYHGREVESIFLMKHL